MTDLIDRIGLPVEALRHDEYFSLASRSRYLNYC